MLPAIDHSPNRPVRFMAPLRHVWKTWYKEITNLFFTQSRSAVQSLTARRIVHARARTTTRVAAYTQALTAAQTAAQDLTMRTESLLNQVSNRMDPHEDPASAQEHLRTLIGWRQASITQYPQLVGLHINPGQQDALTCIEKSYDDLGTAAERDEYRGNPVFVTHAMHYYDSIRELPQKQAGTLVRYGGAFGKKQFLPQLFLSAGQQAADSILGRSPIPEFIQDAIKHDAFGSVEALLSHGFDILISRLLRTKDVDAALLAKFDSTLEYLKPFLPDSERRSFLTTKLPYALQGMGDDPIQQGHLLTLLDLIPNSRAALRDTCIDEIEKLAQMLPEARRAHRPICLLQWKALFVKKAASQLPLSLIENINGMLEETLSPLLEGVHSSIAELITGHLFSYGTYWLEIGYDHKEHPQEGTYFVKIYASGTAMTERDYPRNGDRPLWPIHITGIPSDFPSVMQPWLKKMSETTALTKGWTLPKKDSAPLTASALFGPDGLIAYLQRRGGMIVNDPSDTLPPQNALFSQADLVSHYCHATANPSYLRYHALRKALLQVCAPFAQAPASEAPPGAPPFLALPEGQAGDQALNLLQTATDALYTAAQQGNIDAQGLREIAAFQRQLDLNREAREAQKALNMPHLNHPDETLGVLVDRFLQAYCPTEEQLVHLFKNYSPLLEFLFEDARFINALIDRAGQLLTERQAAPDQARAQEKVSPYIPRHQRGWIGQTLNSFIVQGIITFFSALHTVAATITPNAIQIELREFSSSVMDTLREQLFNYLFPKLKEQGFIKSVQKALKEVLPVVTTQVPPNLDPNSLPKVGREEVPYPASNEQTQHWCMPWAHFCPASSTTLLVSCTTGRPICHMSTFELRFSPTQTQAEEARWESIDYPGFWIALEQTMPFGLILENAEGQQQLLLPSNSLPRQALYMQLSPLLGILGQAVQRKVSTRGNKYYCYERTDRGWESKDPSAMIHLLLLCFASQTRQELYQIGANLFQLQRPAHFRMEPLKQELLRIGEHLLQMPLPAELEEQLLPLMLTLDPETQHLYARLLAKFEIPPPLNEKTTISTDWVGLQILPWTIQARIRSLRIKSGHAPSLIDRGISALRIWNASTSNSLLTHPLTVQAIASQGGLQSIKSTFQLAFPHLTSQTVRAIPHVICTAFALRSPIHCKSSAKKKAFTPNQKTLNQHTQFISLLSIYKTLAFTKSEDLSDDLLNALFTRYQNLYTRLLSHYYPKRVPKSKDKPMLSQVSPDASLIDVEHHHRTAKMHQRHAASKPGSLSETTLDSDFFCLTAQMHRRHAALEPESLNEETLIPDFFCYLDMAQGKCGASKQIHLTHQLYALHCHTTGKHKQLSQLLLRVAQHPSRYAFYDQMKNSDCLCDKTCDLNTLVAFNNLSPRWDVIQSIAMGCMYLMGTFYVLPAVSEKVISSTIFLIPDHIEPINGLSINLVLGVAAILLQGPKTFKHARVPQSCNAPLTHFNQATGMHVTARTLSIAVQPALFLFGVHCLRHYTSQALNTSSSLPTSTPLIDPTYPADPTSLLSDPLLSIALLITYLPIMKLLYNGFHIALIAQNLPQNPQFMALHPKIVEIKPDSAPPSIKEERIECEGGYAGFAGPIHSLRKGLGLFFKTLLDPDHIKA